MSIPYSFLKVLNKEEPYLDRKGRLPEKQAEYLMKNENMKGLYLGACLDSIRWGGEISVMYKLSVSEIVNFIDNWMKQNQGNFEQLFHEKEIGELYKKFELPYIENKKCPKEESHTGRIKDLLGVVRCAHETPIEMRKTFSSRMDLYDHLSQLRKYQYFENEPVPDIPSDLLEQDGIPKGWENEWREYLQKQTRYENEEPQVIAKDLCLAILSERDVVFSLEKILERLKENSGQLDSIFTFDGWDMGFYVQRWWEQEPKGKAPLYESKLFE